MFYVRYTNSSNWVKVEFSGTNSGLNEKVSGSASYLDTNTAGAMTEDVWYDVRVLADGDNVKVWIAEDGEMPELIFDETVQTVNESSSKVGFANATGSTVEYDDVWLVGASLSNTTTYAYNTANELTSMTGPNGTTTYSYDELGRMTNKSRSSFSADYSWHYNDMLTEVDTDFPGESDVTYEYGGDGKRRERTTGGVTTTYNFGMGMFPVSEQDSSGDLIRAHTVDGFVEGTNPATGTAYYGWYSQVGSTRSLYDSSKDQVSAFGYSPYGEIAFAHDDTTVSQLFGGLEWDDAVSLYTAPYRAYLPIGSRWISRDPLGLADGTNVYSYAKLNPGNFNDSLGLLSQRVKDNLLCMGTYKGLSDGPIAELLVLGGTMLLVGNPYAKSSTIKRMQTRVGKFWRNILGPGLNFAKNVGKLFNVVGGAMAVTGALAYSYKTCDDLNNGPRIGGNGGIDYISGED